MEESIATTSWFERQFDRLPNWLSVPLVSGLCGAVIGALIALVCAVAFDISDAQVIPAMTLGAACGAVVLGVLGFLFFASDFARAYNGVLLQCVRFSIGAFLLWWNQTAFLFYLFLLVLNGLRWLNYLRAAIRVTQFNNDVKMRVLFQHLGIKDDAVVAMVEKIKDDTYEGDQRSFEQDCRTVAS
jgi:integral membrane sensor domain MASE1